MLSKDQRRLIANMAQGHKLWRAHVEKGNRHHPRTAETWRLKVAADVNVNVSTATVRAVLRAGLVEPTGLLYWRLTAAGRAEAAKAEGAS